MGISISKCARCAECFTGDSYRVVSETDSVTFLDMVVCYDCYIEAGELGLDTETVEVQRYAVR
jgi:superfamily II helicase